MAAQWETLLCNQMGWPLATGEGNAIIFRCLDLWAASEGIDPADNNWLATSWDLYGNQAKIPGTPVSIFNSVDDGVTAIVNTLNGGGYEPVNAAFSAGSSEVDIYRAINESPWCRDLNNVACQNGFYPIALYSDVSADLGPAAGAPTTPVPNTTPWVFGSTSYDQLMTEWWYLLAIWVEQTAPALVADLGFLQAVLDET